MSASAPMKVLFQTDLEELATSDKEGLGTLRFDSRGKVYRWIKNASGTNLIAKGCCLCKFVTTEADVDKRVMSPDVANTGPVTALITMPAGVPISGICCSGSDTGDHGWIQVGGVAKVSMRQTADTTLQQPGCHAIATTICVTNDEWGAPYTSTIDSANTDHFSIRSVQIAVALATTGVATVASAIVRVHCLGF